MKPAHFGEFWHHATPSAIVRFATCRSPPTAVHELRFKDPWGAKRPNKDTTWSNWQVGGPPRPVAGAQLWAKPLGAGKVAALFINGGRTSRSTDVSLKELNLTAASTALVKMLLDEKGELPPAAEARVIHVEKKFYYEDV